MEIYDKDEVAEDSDLNNPNEDVEIVSGDYWIDKKYDRVRLVRSLNIIDNILHSVVVMTHPRLHTRSETFTLNEFLIRFKEIDQPEAQKIRDNEIKSVQEEIQKTSQELAIGYIDEDGKNANELLTRISEQSKTDMSLPISMAKDNTLSKTKDNIEKIKAITNKQSDFINDKTNLISQNTNVMTQFYQEKADQSLASIDGTLKFISKLQKSVHTLDIFLGKGVEVTRLSTGKEADKDNKITFYQRKLFLDEEWFFNLNDGGADYTSLGDFSKALEQDISIIDRILPSQKSVVLMAYRRKEKQERRYSNPNHQTSLAEAMFKASQDQANRENFLFVRNGENIFMITSEDLLGGKRLFPTNTEINKLFKKEGASKFTGIEVDKYLHFSDVENVKARDKHESIGLYYKRLLILLYGIHDKDGTKEMFGEFADSRYTDWFSLDFQNKNVKFVQDDEDALGYKSESVSTYMDRHNDNIQVGSCVIGDWYRVMNEDNATGMYSNPFLHDPQQIWRPINTDKPQLVKSIDGKLYCSIECYHHWDSDKLRNIKVFLDKVHDKRFLVIDRVKSKDIKYFLDSRSHREEYADFAQFLIGARNLLNREESEAKPSIEFLLSHIMQLYKDIDSKELETTIEESIVFWKRNNSRDALPYLKDDSKALKEISNIFAKKVSSTLLLEQVKQYAKDENLEVLKITTNNKDKYFIYHKVEVEDRIEFGEYESYPFINKTTVLVQKKGIKRVDTIQLPLDAGSSLSEDILFKIKDETKVEFSNIDVKYITKIETLKETIMQSMEFLEKIKSGANIDEWLRRLLDHKYRLQRCTMKKQILNYNISFPSNMFFAETIRNEQGYKYYGATKYLLVLEINTNIDMLVARYGSDELFASNQEWIRKKYARPDSDLATLKEIRRSKSFIFSMGNSFLNFMDSTFKVQRLKNNVLINTHRYSSYPVHSSYNKKEIEEALEYAQKTINNKTHKIIENEMNGITRVSF